MPGSTESDIARRIMESMSPAARDYLFPRDPRWAYWRTPDGYEFLYTTERGGDGKFWSAVLVPQGKGARSGKPREWRTTREVHHATRKAAKARAYRLFLQRNAAQRLETCPAAKCTLPKGHGPLPDGATHELRAPVTR